MSGKLDTLAQLMSEINADTSRTAETVIPQLEGDQGAIDAANEQAAAMGGMGGAPPMPGDMGAGAPPEMPPEMPPADMGAPDMGAPGPNATPEEAGAMVGAPGEPTPVPEELPVGDDGMGMPPEGTPGPDMAQETPMGDMGAPDMGAPDMGAPDMGGEPAGQFDFSQFQYTPQNALDDFISSMTDEAHMALDAGDMAKVETFTQFIEGVKSLWEQFMGGSAMPNGLDESQAMDIPPAAPVDDSAIGAVADGEAPEGAPEEAPEEAAEEESEPAPEAPAEDSGDKEEKSDDKKDDDKKEDDKMSKSEGEAPVDGAIEESCGAEKGEDEDEVKEDAVEKSGHMSLKDRFEMMAKVMEDKTDYMDQPIPLCKSQVVEYEKTADVDMRSIIEEFRNGGIVKSSRPPAESVMGDFRQDAKEATKQTTYATELLENMRKSQQAPERDLDDVEKSMEQLTANLRARAGV